MLSTKIQGAINAQIGAEMWSAYFYLSMAMDAEVLGLKGVSNWYRKQYDEEMAHAFKFIGYMAEQNARVELKPITEVPSQWGCPVKMFEDTLAHEKKVTALIWNLCDIAAEEKDYATTNFLQYYVKEQVEEEATAQGILDAMKMVEGDKAAFYMLDKELGKR